MANPVKAIRETLYILKVAYITLRISVQFTFEARRGLIIPSKS